MNLPATITLIRHDVSVYNQLRKQKEKDPLYKKFLKKYRKNPESYKTQFLAKEVAKKFPLEINDKDIPLVDSESPTSEIVGKNLSKELCLPDVIFVSPYLRTQETLFGLIRGWEQLQFVPTINEYRIREKEHGLKTLYNDKEIYYALHPEQRRLCEYKGTYQYQYPGGESTRDTFKRIRDWLILIMEEYTDQNILIIGHQITLLSIMAFLEKKEPEKFFCNNRKFFPINCGVTLFRRVTDTKKTYLKREYYNRKFY